MSETSSSAINDKCQWCGMSHSWAPKCPSVKAFEYHPNGSIKRVEFYDPQPIQPNYNFGPRYPWDHPVISQTY
jgi:hypothetical protein